MSAPASSSTGRTVVLTGSTGAIGTEIAKYCADTADVDRIILIVRDKTRGAAIAQAMSGGCTGPQVELELAELDSISSTAACGARIREKLLASKSSRISLINNAAVVPKTREVSKDGIELQFAVNVVAYHVLIRELLPAMGKDSRVVCVASDLAGGLDLRDWNWEQRQYGETAAYKATKQANRMMCSELAARLARGEKDLGAQTGNNVFAASVMPGVVTSKLLSALWAGGKGWDSASQAATGPASLALAGGVSTTDSGRFWASGKNGSGAVARNCEWADEAGWTQQRKALWEVCDDLWRRFAKTGGGGSSGSGPSGAAKR